MAPRNVVTAAAGQAAMGTGFLPIMARDTCREPASAAVEYFNGRRKGSQDAGSAMFDTKPYKRPNLIKFDTGTVRGRSAI
jgi:hypothetical protein